MYEKCVDKGEGSESSAVWIGAWAKFLLFTCFFEKKLARAEGKKLSFTKSAGMGIGRGTGMG